MFSTIINKLFPCLSPGKIFFCKYQREKSSERIPWVKLRSCYSVIFLRFSFSIRMLIEQALPIYTLLDFYISLSGLIQIAGIPFFYAFWVLSDANASLKLEMFLYGV